MTFEKQLCQSWEQLAATLGARKRIFATKDKDPRELEVAFAAYLGSMDEASMVFYGDILHGRVFFVICRRWSPAKACTCDSRRLTIVWPGVAATSWQKALQISM